MVNPAGFPSAPWRTVMVTQALKRDPFLRTRFISPDHLPDRLAYSSTVCFTDECRRTRDRTRASNSSRLKGLGM